MRHDFELDFEKRFHFFFCVLIINEHRMRIQKFAKENVLSLYEMTRYSRIFHVLIIFSLRFKSELFSRIDLQKSFSLSSSFSSASSSSSSSTSSSQISVRFHDCRDRYELYTFTNKSSRSRILSIDERRRNNELIVSKRNWEKTRNNVTSVHRIQHLTELTSN